MEEQIPEGIAMEIFCPGRGEVLSILRNFVCSFAESMGFTREEIAKIEISVDEACANVVKHAYNQCECLNRDKSKIKISLWAADDRLRIEISDMGVGNSRGPHTGIKDLEEYKDKKHGLGTYIIQKFMDEVDVIYPAESGTVVTMVKFLRSQD